MKCASKHCIPQSLIDCIFVQFKIFSHFPCDSLIVPKLIWKHMLRRDQLFYDSMDYSPPGSSVHGILQARILQGVAISSFRGYSQPRDQNQVCCTAGRFFTTELPGKPSMQCGSHESNRPESREREAVVEGRDDGKLVGGVTLVICALELFRKLYPISTLGNEVGSDEP